MHIKKKNKKHSLSEGSLNYIFCKYHYCYQCTSKINKTFTSFNLHILSIAYHTSINLQSISAIVVFCENVEIQLSAVCNQNKARSTHESTQRFSSPFLLRTADICISTFPQDAWPARG